MGLRRGEHGSGFQRQRRDRYQPGPSAQGARKAAAIRGRAESPFHVRIASGWRSGRSEEMCGVHGAGFQPSTAVVVVCHAFLGRWPRLGWDAPLALGTIADERMTPQMRLPHRRESDRHFENRCKNKTSSPAQRCSLPAPKARAIPAWATGPGGGGRKTRGRAESPSHAGTAFLRQLGSEASTPPLPPHTPSPAHARGRCCRRGCLR